MKIFIALLLLLGNVYIHAQSNYNELFTRGEEFRSKGLYSRPLKSAHLRNIVRKQYPADFFNKPQKSPHGSFEVVCGGS